eukprot:m.318549 g.318549  ORF g.318549 m.318549 type:complete len:65 (-) comp20290_c0_seq7:2654-2848(-)
MPRLSVQDLLPVTRQRRDSVSSAKCMMQNERQMLILYVRAPMRVGVCKAIGSDCNKFTWLWDST